MTMSVPATFKRQKIREVGARELRHNTAAVIRSVHDGERIVVTRHAEPQAIVFSLRDAVGLCVEGVRPALAAAAERDYDDGRVQDLRPPGPYRVVLALAAARSCEGMGARDRRQLRDSLVRGEAVDDRLLWLPSGRWVAAFSYIDEATALVHQAFEVRELVRALVGDAIWGRRRRIELDRWLHSRGALAARP